MVASVLDRGTSKGERIIQQYQDIVRPHVDSFDNFVDSGMAKVTAAVPPVRVRTLLPLRMLDMACSRVCKHSKRHSAASGHDSPALAYPAAAVAPHHVANTSCCQPAAPPQRLHTLRVTLKHAKRQSVHSLTFLSMQSVGCRWRWITGGRCGRCGLRRLALHTLSWTTPAAAACGRCCLATAARWCVCDLLPACEQVYFAMLCCRRFYFRILSWWHGVARVVVRLKQCSGAVFWEHCGLAGRALLRRRIAGALLPVWHSTCMHMLGQHCSASVEPAIRTFARAFRACGLGSCVQLHANLSIAVANINSQWPLIILLEHSRSILATQWQQTLLHMLNSCQKLQSPRCLSLAVHPS